MSKKNIGIEVEDTNEGDDKVDIDGLLDFNKNGFTLVNSKIPSTSRASMKKRQSDLFADINIQGRLSSRKK
jgi:hypothetical protein